MAATSPPFRIDGEVYQSAATSARHASRSTSQQITHWARLGRELEASGAVAARDVAAVLDGTARYDDASPYVQAAVRAEWDDAVRAAAGTIDMAAELAADGASSWVELDEHGEVVERSAAAPR